MISKTLRLELFSGMSFLCALPTFADFYAGSLVSYSTLEFKLTPSALVVEESPFLLQAQMGYFFNDYFALEARYGTSVRRDASLAVDRIANGFIKLNMPITERLALYGLGGYSEVQVNQKNLGESNEQSVSFGLGMHYALNKNDAIIFEFVDSSSGDSVRLNAVTFGLQHRF